jgi:hypothetical protein
LVEGNQLLLDPAQGVTKTPRQRIESLPSRFFPDRGSAFFPDRGSFESGGKMRRLNAGIRLRMVRGRVILAPSQGAANAKLGLRTHLGPARRSALPGRRRI